MADTGRDEGPGSVHDVLGRLREVTDRLWGLAGSSPAALRSLPSLPPMPGALSAAQLDAITKGVRAQRQQIRALQDQLGAFDQQLAVLEQMLEPLSSWSTTWADLERAFANLRPGRTEGPAARE